MFGQQALLLVCVVLANSWPQLVWGQRPWRWETTPGADNIVFRGDMISPHDLRVRGGFWPRGMTNKRRPYELPMNISLYNHAEGAVDVDSRDDWGFVSTSFSHSVALNWIMVRKQLPGYMYAIHATPNFINVEQTLQQFTIHPDTNDYAAVGHVHYNQVVAWRRVEEDAALPGGLRLSLIEANPLYDEEFYGNKTWGGAQYRLAGFPSDHDVVVQGRQPWCDAGGCQPKSPRSAALELLGSNVRIRSLRLHFLLTWDLMAGTNDMVLIRIGDSAPITLMKAPSRGAQKHFDIDLEYYFGDADLRLSNLTSIRILQRRNSRIWADDFMVRGIVLEIMTVGSRVPMQMAKFSAINRWVGTRAVGTTVVWRRQISVEDWDLTG
ncbi:putative enterotoxin [Ophiocordyceps unilateralis]|uniref:Enterotoxin n=1 Tax=Ophiocordyceps unilateralis TaxID=268505 RepID=A0A2A9P892_OPHUN|nr:putative enterotoxin [Ophiocordyceps unilateralis]